MQIIAVNILALWGVPKEFLLLGGGAVLIVILAAVAWFVMGDSDKAKKPKKKKTKPIKEKNRDKGLKKQQKIAAKKNKPKKEKTPKPPKAKKVKAAKPKKKTRAKVSYKITAAQYEHVTELIGKNKSVLLTSCSRQALPVTIPVKVATQLAANSKCLLIDLDIEHNSIAKAFNLEDTPGTKHLRPMPYKTSFENLFIWPSHNFVRSGHMNINHLVSAAQEKYDHVLISCPSLNLSPDRKLIASSAAKTIIFSQDNQDTEYLTDLIGSRGGDILANIEIIGQDKELLLDDLVDIEGQEAGMDIFDEETESLKVEPEIDFGADLDDLIAGDHDEQIDPDIINDLFADDEDETS